MLFSSQFVSLIFALGVGGLISTMFYYIINMVKEYVARRMICSVVIENLDPTYQWLLQFLTQKGYLADQMSDSVVRIVKKKREWFQPKASKEKPKIEYYPAPGLHYFKYRGRTMWAVQEQGKINLVGWENKPQTSEKIIIMCYGGSTEIIQQLIDDAVVFSMDLDKGLLGIYQTYGWLSMWVKVMTKKARTLDSVVLDSDIASQLETDIRDFQNSGEWYMSKGVPYRRGYLLFGPPGTGKTSFVQAIAGQLKLNLCYLNLSSGEVDDDSLNRLLSEAPDRSIILLEDIDAMFTDRTSMSTNKLSFSGFLNALDGVRSQEGQILFMTTNHKERLDPALLRPGRADVHVKLNYASDIQMKGLFCRFFPESEDLAVQFANQLPVSKLSMAKLQGHMLRYREDVEKCVANAKELMLDEKVVTKEMVIDDWLHRLNLLRLKPNFEKQKIRRVQDLIYIIDQGQFAEFEITDKLVVRRLWNMLIGEQETKDSFNYLSKHGIRAIGQIFISNPRQLDELVDYIPEGVLTGFHLRDIFDAHKKTQEIKDKIYDTIIFNKRFPKTLEISKAIHKGPVEDEKKKSKIDFDLTKFFTDLGATDCINKLQKQDLNDPELFFKVEYGTIESTLDLKPQGKKLRIMKKIKELRDKYEKEGYIEYLDQGLLEGSELPSLKFVKSTTMKRDTGKKDKDLNSFYSEN